MKSTHELEVTSNTLEMNNLCLGTSQQVFRPGSSHLDIGGGLSSVTAELAEEYGVSAFSVDAGYSDVDGLLQPNLKLIEEYDRKLDPASKVVAQVFKHGRERFILDLASNPDRYIAGDARSLPFQDESFDFVQSCLMLTSSLAVDSDFAMRGICEAARVLKRGGVLAAGQLVSQSHRGPDQQVRRNVLEAFNAVAGRKDKISQRNVGGLTVIHFSKSNRR